jgi:DNA-binding IclR family transcriptional regulator
MLKEEPLKAGEIIKKLGGDETVGRTTVWRRLKELMKEGIVEYDNETKRYKLTNMGFALF